MKRFSTVLFSLSLAAGLPMVTHADDKDDSTYSLTYSAADLSSREGVAALHQKIEKTARDHCPSYFSIRSISDSRACVRDVSNDLVKSIDNPQLTAYAAGEEMVEMADASPRG